MILKSLLLDYNILNNAFYTNDIKKYNRNLYKKYKNKLGCIIFISLKLFNKLKNTNKGINRYDLINNNKFIKEIVKKFYFLYDPKINGFKLLSNPNNKNDFYLIFECIRSDISIKDVVIFVETELKREKINLLLDMNFQNPYNCRKTIFEKQVKNTLTLSRLLNQKVNNILMKKIIKQEIKNVISSDNRNCNISLQFSKECVNKFYGYIYDKIDGKTQNEVAGKLVVEKIQQKNNMINVTLNVDDKTLSKGANEHVDGVLGKYTFHTHPQDCYINNNVKIGWPSGQDFAGYHAFDLKCYIHGVVTMEGLYIIMYDKYASSNVGKLNIEKNYIKHLSIKHKSGCSKYEIENKIDCPAPVRTPQQFCNKINNVKDPYGNSIFNVQFRTWDEMKIKPIFNVSFYVGIPCCPF